MHNEKISMVSCQIKYMCTTATCTHDNKRKSGVINVFQYRRLYIYSTHTAGFYAGFVCTHQRKETAQDRICRGAFSNLKDLEICFIYFIHFGYIENKSLEGKSNCLVPQAFDNAMQCMS